MKKQNEGMKLICPVCEGNGQIDHMEHKTDKKGDSYYKCIRCGMIGNYKFICDCINNEKTSS